MVPLGLVDVVIYTCLLAPIASFCLAVPALIMSEQATKDESKEHKSKNRVPRSRPVVPEAELIEHKAEQLLKRVADAEAKRGTGRPDPRPEGIKRELKSILTDVRLIK